jgi:hypothetical protein
MEKPFNDIAFIPHFYNYKWATDLNQTLARLFFVPDEYYLPFIDKYKFEENSYLPGKSQLHVYISKLLPILRSKGITKIFYCNLGDDFSLDFQNAGFIKSFGGILHATNHEIGAIGQNKKFVDYENAIGRMATQVFVGSTLLQKSVPFDTIPIGLPVHTEIKAPQTSDMILFSHRLMADKNANMLFQLPPHIKDKVIISAPGAATAYIAKAKAEFKHFYFKIPTSQYLSLLESSGVGISFASHDPFGYSVMEGIFAGQLYFVPNIDTTSYKQYILDELRFDSIDEFIEKYEYYVGRPEERREIVLRQQEKVKHLQVNQWVENFKNKLTL